MKTKILSSMLLLSLVSGCAKDVKVDESGRFKTRADEKAARNSGGKAKNLRFGSYAGVALIAEKQVEVLEVLSLSLANQTKNSTQYTREVTKDAADGHGVLEQTVLLKSNDKTPLSYTVGTSNFSLMLDKQWEVNLTYANGKLVAVKAAKVRRAFAKPDPKKPDATMAQVTKLDAVGANKGKTYVSVFENELSFTATLAEDGETLNVTAVSEMSIRAKRSDVYADSEEFTLNLGFKINTDALQNDEVIATKDFVGSVKYASKPTVISTSSPLMKVRLENLCSDLEGVASIDQDRTKKTVVFAKDVVTVTGTDYRMPVASCGQRPTVDLSRYLTLLY